MKRLFPLLLAISLASCRKRPEPLRGETAVPIRKSLPIVSAPVNDRQSPPPLLKTPRVTLGISFLTHRTIQTAAEADAILADLRTLPPSKVRDGAIASIIGSLAEVDPTAARERLEAWDEALIPEWLAAAKALVRVLAESDPAAGADFIEAVPAPARADVWLQFLRELPPAARLGYFPRIPDSQAKLRMAADLALVWVAADPAACAAWMDSFAAGKNAGELRDLGNPLTQPPDAARTAGPWLAAFRHAKTPEARRVFAAKTWQKSDPDTRAGLIAELHDAIPETVAGQWEDALRTDPAGYAAALTPEQVAGFSTEDMGKLLGRWAEKSPQDAIDWALEHERPEAASVLMSLYFLEPDAALALPAKLPPGDLRDQAVSGLAQRLAFEKKPAAARALLPFISDPGFRERIREAVENK